MSPKEIHVGFLATKPDGVPLFSLLKDRLINGGRITQVQAVLDGDNLTPGNLVEVVRLAFGVEIELRDIHAGDTKISERDRLLAGQFGFTVLPLAYASLNGGQVEAWIQPTLVLEEHPLARTGNKNAAMITTEPFLSLDSLSQNHALSYGETTAAHYLRMTARDHPGVLAGITREFAARNINVRGVIQPKAEEGSKVTDIAFILSPCQTHVFQSALASIMASKNVLETNAVFRVLL